MNLGKTPDPLPTEPEEIARALVTHPRWEGVKPRGLYSVDVTADHVTGYLLTILHGTGKFGYLVFNRHTKKWVCQYSSHAGGHYPEHDHAGCACALGILSIWREEKQG